LVFLSIVCIFMSECLVARRRRLQSLSEGPECRGDMWQQVRTAELIGTNCEAMVRAAGALLKYLGTHLQT
jgi:hypothetical protein